MRMATARATTKNSTTYSKFLQRKRKSATQGPQDSQKPHHHPLPPQPQHLIKPRPTPAMHEHHNTATSQVRRTKSSRLSFSCGSSKVSWDKRHQPTFLPPAPPSGRSLQTVYDHAASKQEHLRNAATPRPPSPHSEQWPSARLSSLSRSVKLTYSLTTKQLSLVSLIKVHKSSPSEPTSQEKLAPPSTRSDA